MALPNYYDPYAEAEDPANKSAYGLEPLQPVTSIEPITSVSYTPEPTTGYTPPPTPPSSPDGTYSGTTAQPAQTFTEMQSEGYARPPAPDAGTTSIPMDWSETIYTTPDGGVTSSDPSQYPQPQPYQEYPMAQQPPPAYEPPPVVGNMEQQLYDQWQQSQSAGFGFMPSAPYNVTPPQSYDYQAFQAPSSQFQNPGTYSPVSAPTPTPMEYFSGDTSVQNIASPTPYGYTPFTGADYTPVAAPQTYGYTQFSGSYTPTQYNERYAPSQYNSSYQMVNTPDAPSLGSVGSEGLYRTTDAQHRMLRGSSTMRGRTRTGTTRSSSC